MARFIRATLLVEAGTLFNQLGARAVSQKEPVRIKLNAVSKGVTLKGIFRVEGMETVIGHTTILHLSRRKNGPIVARLDWNEAVIISLEVIGARSSGKRVQGKIVSVEPPERRLYR